MMVAKGMVISPACCYLGVKCRVLRNAVSNELITGSVGGRTKRSPYQVHVHHRVANASA